jgi:hypothetical protein
MHEKRKLKRKQYEEEFAKLHADLVLTFGITVTYFIRLFPNNCA